MEVVCLTKFKIIQPSFNFSVMDFENDIMYAYDCTDAMDEYTSCLHIRDKVVAKHIPDAPTDLRIDTPIPFTIKVFEKVFLTPDKADIDEKDESDQDEEDGK